MSRVANGTDLSAGYLGGLDWDLMIFNWHPLFMSSFVALAVLSSVSWMLSPFTHAWAKVLHGALHTAGAICLSLGLYAVFTAHSGQNESHTPYANLATLHSWVGLAAIICYLSNYVLGALHFFLQLSSEASRKGYLPSHRTVGIISLFVSVCAVVAGIMETIPCDYSVTANDANPAAHYTQLSMGCRLANGAGISLLAAAMLAGFALMGPDGKAGSPAGRKEEDDGFSELLLNRG